MRPAADRFGVALMEVAPGAAVAAVLLLAIAHLIPSDPAGRTALAQQSIDGTIVRAQAARAPSVGEVDVLFLGDSSVLMGIVPAVLEAAFPGKRIEVLASIGFTGPSGNAAMLERFLSGGGRARTIVVGFTYASLNHSPQWDGWVGVVRDPSPVKPANVRDRYLAPMRYGVLGVVAPHMLPGAYGRAYGDAPRVVRYMLDHRGAMFDPRPGILPEDMIPVVYETSPTLFSGLSALRLKLEESGSREIFYLDMPIPEALASSRTRATRATAISEVAAALGIEIGRILSTPETIDAASFASTTHLSVTGREAFTRSLGVELGRRAF
jgi:hypothetical protein